MNTQLTLRVTQQTKQRFTDAFEALKAAGKVFTQAEGMEYIMNAYENPPTVEVEKDTPETLRKLAEAEQLCSELEAAKTAAEQQMAENAAAANDEISRLQEQIRQLTEFNDNARLAHDRQQQELNEATAKIESLKLKPFTARLLELTAERLGQRYSRQIAPIEVLSDMFLKYTIQQYSQWFYPFVLNDREIISVAANINPAITSIKQVKAFCNIK